MCNIQFYAIKDSHKIFRVVPTLLPPISSTRFLYILSEFESLINFGFFFLHFFPPPPPPFLKALFYYNY